MAHTWTNPTPAWRDTQARLMLQQARASRWHAFRYALAMTLIGFGLGLILALWLTSPDWTPRQGSSLTPGARAILAAMLAQELSR